MSNLTFFSFKSQVTENQRKKRELFPSRKPVDLCPEACFNTPIARQCDLASDAKGSFTSAQSGYLGATLAACDPPQTRDKGLAESGVPSVQSVRPIKRKTSLYSKAAYASVQSTHKSRHKDKQSNRASAKPLGTNPSAKPSRKQDRASKAPRFFLSWI